MNILQVKPPGNRKAIPVSKSSTYPNTNNLKKNQARVFMSFAYLDSSSGVADICELTYAYTYIVTL